MPVADAAVHLDAADLAAQMADDVRAGLTDQPRTLPPKYFYDGRGSELFDEITRLPEYYPTRTERVILEDVVTQVAAASGAETLVELGSGTSDKTRLLLGALRSAGSLVTFVPFDVDPVVLEQASVAVAGEFPGLVVAPVVGDFERHLGELPAGGRRLVAFLGSTIGNLAPEQRTGFLASLRASLEPGDSFLLGTDLVKAPERLVAAYDDAAGVTAEFNRNVLAVVNRSLGADFDLDAFDHVARWDEASEWMEMRLRARAAQSVHVQALDLRIELAEGEEIRTEISAKFRREGIERELRDAGFALRQWWTDPAEDYALSLSEPV